MSVASMIRDNYKGKRITYSRKIFIPLTNICRNRCGYCGFRKEPDDNDAEIMEPSKVLSFAKAGSKANCTEALFTLGEKPEQRYQEVSEELKRSGYNSILEYLRDMCEMVIKKTGLLPHSNPGVMTKSELADLKDVNASMGLMLENVSNRLCDKGGPHEFSPSKRPELRLATIENAGQLKIPFTTGLLIGIGESPEEIIDSLYAIKKINEKYGHIQEIIIQNFRAKPKTPMESHSEPDVKDIVKTIALARLIFLGKMNIQAPPNLSNEYSAYLSAGINDWGGISPVTKDFVNPEAPWPEIKVLKRVTEQKGFELKARLPVYPEFILNKADLLPKSLKSYIISLVDEEAFVKGGF
ncbi:MAG: 7,8-didemethyl-8-hydroxy-5-deazariboflavin synthase CofG [archaeon]|nr:7,8-didemethyl-8-hydroxy-5-deazariboflavin synthase CofG [archaeon]MCP8314242.1 7,8-didemethyl-8-hydroxy-5-deazariboflavin synthase CofG [archaeon]